jgi:succinate dehydrogenase / fumarate reductase iron-sulfur subunit
MDEVGFGNCTNQYECEASCPKGISVSFISRMNRDFICTMAKDTSDVGDSAAG